MAREPRQFQPLVFFFDTLLGSVPDKWGVIAQLKFEELYNEGWRLISVDNGWVYMERPKP